MDSRFLNQAISIGDQLLRMSHHDKHGIYWEAATIDHAGNRAWHIAETLYSGTSGIALFLIELHKHTGDTAYLQAAKEAMAWTLWYCKTHPTDNYALLTGRMGVAYTLLQLYNVTVDKTLLEAALGIAKPCSVFVDDIKEYINGTAGTLLGLLHVHAATQEPWLLERIDEYTQSFVRAARLSKVGTYWDSSPSEIRPLCGFSHGVSGIGFVFLELGRYLNNPAFYLFAEQAFAYENACFDPKTGNWPDFRLSMWREDQVAELEQAYQAGKLEMFTQAQDMNAWCHGAAGIALSRLHPAIISNRQYRQDVTRALAKTTRTLGYFDNFSLCHGEGGNAEAFIETYRLFHNPADLAQAQKIGDAALRQKKLQKRFRPGIPATSEQAEDTSLFNGIAGVGYFLLRLHDPDKTPSILAPRLQAATDAAQPPKHRPFLSVRLPELQRQLIANTFPRSVHVAEQCAPQKTRRYFAKKPNAGSLKQDFIRFMTELPASPAAPGVFALERFKTELADQVSSSGLLYIKARVEQKSAQQLLQLPDDTLLTCTLMLAEGCRLRVNNQNEPLLLKVDAQGVSERTVSRFCYMVLQSFAAAKSVGRVADAFTQRYKATDRVQAAMIQERVLAQIREALHHSILVQEMQQLPNEDT